jgi:hypothetical protein
MSNQHSTTCLLLSIKLERCWVEQESPPSLKGEARHRSSSKRSYDKIGKVIEVVSIVVSALQQTTRSVSSATQNGLTRVYIKDALSA